VPFRCQDRAIVSEPEPHDLDRIGIRGQTGSLLPSPHPRRVEVISGSSELFLKLLNEPLAFRFGGEETALQPPFHIPPRFILFDPVGPVVSFDFHGSLNLPW